MLLQSVAVCCSMLQCAAAIAFEMSAHVLGPFQYIHLQHTVLQRIAVCCSVLQCVAVLRLEIGAHVLGPFLYIHLIQYVVVRCSVLQCVVKQGAMAGSCRESLCVAVFFSVLQCVAVFSAVYRCNVVCLRGMGWLRSAGSIKL